MRQAVQHVEVLLLLVRFEVRLAPIALNVHDKLFGVAHPQSSITGDCAHRIHIFTLLVGVDFTECFTVSKDSDWSFFNRFLIVFGPHFLFEAFFLVDKACQVALHALVKV